MVTVVRDPIVPISVKHEGLHIVGYAAYIYNRNNVTLVARGPSVETIDGIVWDRP